MIEIVITSSLLIVVILFLRFALKNKISRRLRYALWLAALFRLLLPFSVPSPVSVMNAVDTAPARRLILGEVSTVSAESAGEGAPHEPGAASGTGGLPGIPASALVWGCGAVLTGGWFAAVNLSFARKLRRTRKPLSGMDTGLPVYLSEGIPSPCLAGLFRPAIYVTPEAAADPVTLRHVLAHESCHRAQLDHIWSAARMLCTSLYWFNPLVWAAAVCSRKDCELACDELAVKRLGEEQRLPYGRTLLSLVRGRPSLLSLSRGATTMTCGARELKARLEQVIRSPKTLLPALAAAVLTLGLAAGCTFTGASRLEPEEAVRLICESAVYEDGCVSFSIPEKLQTPGELSILVSGREQSGAGAADVRFLEHENEVHLWEAGRTYYLDVADRQILELGLSASLKNASSSVSLDTLPPEAGDGDPSSGWRAYRNARVHFSPEPQDAGSPPAFDACFLLPVGWELREELSPEGGIAGDFSGVVEISDGQRPVAWVGYGYFEPYEEEIPQEEYYKTVYPHLRLGSMVNWGVYTPVRSDENSEAAIAEVSYPDPAFSGSGLANAAVPRVVTDGLLCYNKELGAYVGIQFVPGAAGWEQLWDMAESFVLTPPEKD